MTTSLRRHTSHEFPFFMITLTLWVVLLVPQHVLAYWLMGANNVLSVQRIDPIVNPGTVGTHVHSILGGSNFALNLTTAMLQNSTCTSIPINEDKSAYWYPNLYWQRNDGNFTSVSGNASPYTFELNNTTRLPIDYLFSDTANYTTPFPEDFRMISGDPTLRTLNASSFAQQAVTFLCLNFNGQSSKFNELPKNMACPDGVRAQINFPSCWDGVNVDSPDHKSHVSFLSTGPDNGTCNDPNFPFTLPRIFLEVYWNTAAFESQRQDAMNPKQPFVFSYGDPTGYGYHADFFNGWEDGVLQRAINECNCNPYGDPTCCVGKGTFTMQSTTQCYITETFVEAVTGNLSSLPGANPVQSNCFEQFQDTYVPPMISPVVVYTSSAGMPSPSLPPRKIVTPAQTNVAVQSIAPQGTCIAQPGSDAISISGTVSAVIMTLISVCTSLVLLSL